MKKHLTCFFLMLFCMVFFFKPVKIFAEQNSEGPISGFTYEIVYPENQKNKSLSYFDLTVSPEQEQVVSLMLYNSQDEELNIEVNLNTAKTSGIGKVEYGPNELKRDPSLKNDFINIVKGPKQVVIPSKGSKQVDLTISVPKDTPNGLIAGGIQLRPVDQNIKNDQKEKNTVINKFAFLVGVLLRVGDTSDIKPKLELNKIYIAFKEYKSYLFLNMSNINPVYLEGMSVNIQVRKENKKKILLEEQKKGLRMAPNSMIDLPIDLADKGITEGKYIAQIKVTSKDGGKWSWTEGFTVSALDVSNLNENPTENKIERYKIFLWVFAIFSVSFLITILIYRFFRTKQALNRKKKIKKKR